MEELKMNSQPGGNIGDNVKVISMLYDGAVNFTRIARKKIETGDMIGKTLHIKKASAIIHELSSSLNMEGGEISENLKKLYEYVLISYGRAESQNDLKALDDAEKIIEVLNGAWKEMQQASEF